MQYLYHSKIFNSTIRVCSFVHNFQSLNIVFFLFRCCKRFATFLIVVFLKQVFCIVVNIKPNSFNLLIILVESRNNIPITYFRQSAASNSQNASKPRRGPPKYGSQAQPGPSTANVDRDRYEIFFFF